MDACELSEYNMYNVPAISFIGGSRQEYVFSFYESDTTTPVSLIGAAGILFRLVPYGYTTAIILELSGSLISEDPYNSISVIIEGVDSEDLYGKFVYQIIIDSYNSGTYIPVQGILNIYRKIEGNSLLDE